MEWILAHHARLLDFNVGEAKATLIVTNVFAIGGAVSIDDFEMISPLLLPKL